MRRVKQLGFLVVNKQRPKPKRTLQKISYETFKSRSKEYSYLCKVKSINKEDILNAMLEKTKVFSCDIFFAGDITRIVFNDSASLKPIMIKADRNKVWSFSRGQFSYMVIVDTIYDVSIVLRKRKSTVTEDTIWQSSDLNYWS